MRKALFIAPVLAAALMFVARTHADDKATAEVGKVAPAFSLEDQDGKKVSLADFKDKVVVLEWIHPGCPFVIRHYEKQKTMVTLADKYKEKGVVWLAVNSTKDQKTEDAKVWLKKYGCSYPMLNDAKGDVGHSYGAKTTPHMFIVDKSGKLVYAGGIDDDQEGSNAKRVNFVEKALDEILSGKAVSTPQTKSYGCSVKYSS